MLKFIVLNVHDNEKECKSTAFALGCIHSPYTKKRFAYCYSMEPLPK